MLGILLISGPKRSGKTHFIKHLCYQLSLNQKVNFIKVICPTAYNKSYDFLPAEHVSKQYNEVVMYELLEEQVTLLKAGVKRPALLILDDCIGTANFKAPIWEKLATTCRHPNLTVIVVTQHIFQLPPTLCNNADTVIILKTVDVDNLEGLYNICGRWKWRTFKEFESYVIANTDGFKAVVFKGNSVKIVKAPAQLKNFVVKY